MASRSASVDAVRIRGSALPGLQAIAAESNRSFPRHMHDVFGIGVMDRGGQRSASGRGAVEAVRGDVITVNPGEVHDGVAMRGEARAWRMLHLAPALLSDGVPQGFELTRPVLSDPALRLGFDRCSRASSKAMTRWRWSRACCSCCAMRLVRGPWNCRKAWRRPRWNAPVRASPTIASTRPRSPNWRARRT